MSDSIPERDIPPITTQPRCNATFNPVGAAYVLACQACGWADVAGNYLTAIRKAEEHNAG